MRNRVLGLPEGKDWDLMVDGDAIQYAQMLFEQGIGHHAPLIYPQFQSAHIFWRDNTFECTSARGERYVPGSRKPKVYRATLLEDAQRRDFTINALYQHCENVEILDPLGKGLVDIQGSIIRTCHDPVQTFQDDPLRLLRGIRLAAKLGFSFEEGTWIALTEQAERVISVSKERITDELTKLLSIDQSAAGLDFLQKSGVMKILFLDFADFTDIEWDRVLTRQISLTGAVTIEMKLATLFMQVDSVGELVAHLKQMGFSHRVVRRVGEYILIMQTVATSLAENNPMLLRKMLIKLPELKTEHSILLKVFGASEPTKLGLSLKAVEIEAALLKKWQQSRLWHGEEIMRVFNVNQGRLVGLIKNKIEELFIVTPELVNNEEEIVSQVKAWLSKM